MATLRLILLRNNPLLSPLRGNLGRTMTFTIHAVWMKYRCFKWIPSARSDGGPQCIDPNIKTLREKLKEEEKTIEGKYWNYTCIYKAMEKWKWYKSNGLQSANSSASASALPMETEVSEFEMTYSRCFWTMWHWSLF